MKLKSIICLFTSICLIFLSSCNTGDTGDISSAAAKGETAASSLVQSKKENAPISSVSGDEAEKLINSVKDLKIEGIVFYDFNELPSMFAGFRSLKEVKGLTYSTNTIWGKEKTNTFLSDLELDKWQNKTPDLKGMFIKYAAYITEDTHINLTTEHNGIYWASIATDESYAFYSVPKEAFEKLKGYCEQPSIPAKDADAEVQQRGAELISELKEKNTKKIEFFGVDGTYDIERRIYIANSGREPSAVLDNEKEIKNFIDSLKLDEWQVKKYNIKGGPKAFLLLDQEYDICLGPVFNGNHWMSISTKERGCSYVVPKSVYNTIYPYFAKDFAEK